MIYTFVFEFPNGNVYCAGEDTAVKRVYDYFYLQDKVCGHGIDMAKFVDRIVMNGVYAYLEPGTVQDRILELIQGYNRRLKRHGLLITGNEYIEATVLAFPEICCRELELTSDEYTQIKKESIWRQRLDLE